MATMITEDCIACGACEAECPNDAISYGEDIFEVDPDLCSECVGFHDVQMCSEACPVDCCIPNPERSESEELLFARAEKIHAGKGLELSDATSHFRAA